MMKQIFTFLMAMMFATALFAQNTTEIYHEHFPTLGEIADYNWTAIDEDGDGNNWLMDEYESEVYLISESWKDDTPLNPENYLFSPAIDLTGYTTVRVEYFIAAAGSDYYEEHYKCVVAENPDVASANDGEILIEETLTAEESGGVWAQRDFDISSFAGQTIYLGWVHYNCTDMYKLMLDSVTVYAVDNTGMDLQDEVTFTFFPNPAQDQITLRYSGTEKAKAEIYTLNGQLIRRMEHIGNNAIITVADLPAGTYILRVDNGNAQMSQKFTIMK